MRFTHIIWDWNGTLLDDAELSLAIMNEHLVDSGLPALPFDYYRDIFTMPVSEYYRRAGIDLEKIPYEESAKHFILEYARRRFTCALHTGAREALERIRSKGGHNYVLSAYAQSALVELMTHYDILHLFDRVQGISDNLAAGKLAEGLSLIKEIGVDLSATVMIGDTDHDVDVARAMGISAILISNGHQSPKQLAACGVPVVDSVDAALSLIFH